MKSVKKAALAGAGGTGRMSLARMPALLRHLGPVKSSSYRVARRLTNALRHGHAVRDYSEFADCQAIWITGSEKWVGGAAAADLAASIALRGKIVILADAWCDSRSSSALCAAGAYSASLNAVEETRERLFIAEGHPEALRYVRSVLSAERRKLIEIEPASKVLYFAGVQFGANLILASIAGAVEALRAAGFSRQDATLLAQAMGARALRGYGRGGRRAWNVAKTAELDRAIHRELPVLRAKDSNLAKLYENGIARARAFFEADSLQP
ncbi:MAG TPA: DUF2520 domain-containing protein [Bryobacteraceae bacterium]|jgi:predicted short-subunit dehydrogenase-like oxidoreductase (DUF2520 family)|nr:DUF2520 domain-containing protein [Bryobacteraceae bacterium]